MYYIGHSEDILPAYHIWPARSTLDLPTSEPSALRGRYNASIGNCTRPDFARIVAYAALLVARRFGV